MKVYSIVLFRLTFSDYRITGCGFAVFAANGAGASKRLFETQRFNRIQSRRFLRRIEAKKQSHQ